MPDAAFGRFAPAPVALTKAGLGRRNRRSNGLRRVNV